MSNALVIEDILVNGNLASLSPVHRMEYYNRLCETLKLNPLTKPFEYITLNGKLTLYARKDCTDQLRKVHGINIYRLEARTENDVHIVTAYARDMHGREDVSTGAVSIAGLKGEALANAYMKCETKAKRRVTLSIGGLGMLDETEIDSIRTVSPKDVQDVPAIEMQSSSDDLHRIICSKISSISTQADMDTYNKWKAENASLLNEHIASNPEYLNEYKAMLKGRMDFINPRKKAASGEVNGYGSPVSFS